MRTQLSWPPSAQSPFARDGRYPRRGGLASHLEGRYPLVVARTGSCARPSPSPRLGSRLVRAVFAGCRQSLLRDGPSRHYLCDPCVGARTPTPPRSPTAYVRFFRQGHRPHPRGDGFGARNYPHTATSVGNPISRLQSFDHLRAPTLARPPGCSHRSAQGAGRPGLSHHASPGRLPKPGCGVATCSTRTISMTGLSPAGSQPCRLLPAPAGSTARQRHTSSPHPAPGTPAG